MSRRLAMLIAVLSTAMALGHQPVSAAGLTVKDVIDQKGDGPDGKGNTADDTWQFWLQLVHNKKYVPLDTFSTTVPKEGVHKKISGPIAKDLPNPNDTVGWIYHSDWDGCFEGVWGDSKADQVIAYPYVEKGAHCAVAVTYKIPEDGNYKVSGEVTDIHVWEHAKHDGFNWIVELVEGSNGDNVTKVLGKGGPFGDGGGRPAGGTIELQDVEAKKGQLIRLVIHPGNWWGSDMTKIDGFKVEKQ